MKLIVQSNENKSNKVIIDFEEKVIKKKKECITKKKKQLKKLCVLHNQAITGSSILLGFFLPYFLPCFMLLFIVFSMLASVFCLVPTFILHPRLPTFVFCLESPTLVSYLMHTPISCLISIPIFYCRSSTPGFYYKFPAFVFCPESFTPVFYLKSFASISHSLLVLISDLGFLAFFLLLFVLSPKSLPLKKFKQSLS